MNYKNCKVYGVEKKDMYELEDLDKENSDDERVVG
jgi:hypothetical protein